MKNNLKTIPDELEKHISWLLEERESRQKREVASIHQLLRSLKKHERTSNKTA